MQHGDSSMPDSAGQTRPVSATRAVFVAAIVFLGVAGLHVAGYFNPGAPFWGVHFLAFLPSPYLPAYLALSAAALLFCVFGNVERPITAASRLMSGHPAVFVTAAAALFAICGYAVQVRAPLLGDSYTIANNLQNTFRGVHPLHFAQEPTAIYFFYLIARALRATTIPGIIGSFLAGETLLGIGFITCTFFLVRNIIDDERMQFPVFVLLASAPYVQLFFGYVEVYAVVLFMLSAAMLCTALTLKDRLSFAFIPAVFLLLVFVHYLAAMMAPSVVYLAVREIRRNGFRRVAAGLLASAAVLILLCWLVDFDVSRFVPNLRIGHTLSFLPSNDEYQAYTLVSGWHGVDLLNLILLMVPGALMLLLVPNGPVPRETGQREMLTFLGLSIVPFLGFLAATKFDLGLAKDWDISSSFFFLVILFAVLSALRDGLSARVVALAAAMTVLNTLPYVQVNALENASVRRAKALLDDRFVARSGRYQGVFHLSMHYFLAGQIDSMVGQWEQFVQKYPQDIRGYQKLAKAQWELGEAGYGEIIRTYERWKSLDTADAGMRREYAGFCLAAGRKYHSERNFTSAAEMFRRCILIDSTSAGAYNDLGTVCADAGDLGEAEACFRKAIGLNPQYAIGYRNLARIAMAAGDLNQAIALNEKATGLDPGYVGAFEDLASAYLSAGDNDRALQAYLKAARLGSPAARKALTENGIPW